MIQDVATQPGLGALVGEVHMNILRALECVGVVTNGAVRDIPAARDRGVSTSSPAVSRVSHAYVHIVEFGQPVEIDGLNIRSGDLLHGDLHGVQSVPLEIAPQIPAVAAAIRGTGTGADRAVPLPGFLARETARRCWRAQRP